MASLRDSADQCDLCPLASPTGRTLGWLPGGAEEAHTTPNVYASLTSRSRTRTAYMCLLQTFRWKGGELSWDFSFVFDC